MIHPPSGPFVRQGLAAAQQRPLSLTETWLPKADLLRLSPPRPSAPSRRLGVVSIRVCALPGVRGGRGAGYLVGGRGAPPGSCRHSHPATLGPAVDLGVGSAGVPAPLLLRLGT